jgi:N-acetylmuramoyl-L-alanine amidase
MPSALVELAFITNIDDAKILRDKQNELAFSVAKGILNYLGIKYIEKTKIDCSSWSVDAMEWAMKNNLTDGNNPKEPISLERFITILYRYDKTLE